MASLIRRTLTWTTHPQLIILLRTGARIPAAFSVHPRMMRMPSVWTAITSSLRSFSTKLPDERSVPNILEEPRSLPTSGFETIEADRPVEEEELPDYRADRFYPVQLGEVLKLRK